MSDTETAAKTRRTSRPSASERVETLQRDLSQTRLELEAALDARLAAEIERARAAEASQGLRDRLDDERRRAEDLQARIDTLTNRLVDTEAERQRLLFQLETRDTQIAELSPHRQRVHELESELHAARGSLEEARRPRAAPVDDEVDRARTRVSELRRELDETLGKLDRAENEQQTLAALSRQQARELMILRERIDQLLASRWRRLGQKIGVAMVLPWERQVDVKR